MDREARQATVHGVTTVRHNLHDLATKSQYAMRPPGLNT